MKFNLFCGIIFIVLSVIMMGTGVFEIVNDKLLNNKINFLKKNYHSKAAMIDGFGAIITGSGTFLFSLYLLKDRIEFDVTIWPGITVLVVGGELLIYASKLNDKLEGKNHEEKAMGKERRTKTK